MELKNKTAIVCGSTQGIGRAIANIFADNGCNLILITHDEAKLRQVQQEIIDKFGVEVEYLVIDFNNSEQVKNVANGYFDNFSKKIDILVNNVRGPLPASLVNSNKEALIEVFGRHIISSHEITSVVIKNMLHYKTSGRIINICDNTSIAPYPALGLSAIRAAEIAWGQTLSIELAKFGITVNNILPGPTYTPGLEKIIRIIAQNEGISYEEKLNEILISLPLRRMARPEEIANVALFLASEKSSYITGSNIKVDGGFNVFI